ncbi:MAG: PEGA domain-containing protein [Planctomycetes bacterium]|nr:PEGA domain-containing protein [Planctomycetota bacterium]MBI3846223.1 PEGA domain-containing protein [Planctomycetota bacterium]
MFIRSDPPGASVFLEGRRIGTTPVEIPFTYYGTREIVFRKDGFHDLRVREAVREPLYQIFPLDFVFECLVPATLTDRHEVAATLQTDERRAFGQADVDHAVDRARALRDRIRPKP